MKLSNEACRRIAASLDFTKPAGLEAAGQKFLAAKIRAALHGSAVNPLDFGCLWIALIDRDTGHELTNRRLYVEDCPDLTFTVIKPGTGVMGWFAEERGGKALFMTWPHGGSTEVTIEPHHYWLVARVASFFAQNGRSL